MIEVDYVNDKWECHMCAWEKPFDVLPTGYLGNYYPLCERCADEVLNDKENKHRHRLTYHESVGDIKCNRINNLFPIIGLKNGNGI